MGMLMKYEFRKTRMSRMILLLLTVLSEILFLSGLFLDWEKGMFLGILFLTLCAMFGLFYLGIESILVFSKDLNTKQSYMLFMTPKNSYQILGAKALENLLCIIAVSVIFILIAFADISIAAIHLDGLTRFLEEIKYFLNSMFHNLPTWQEVVASIFASLLNWFMTITVGYLAVTLSATVLAGKRLNGLISFILFIVILWAVAVAMEFLPTLPNVTADFAMQYGILLLFSAAFYFISCHIMERKLSV